MTTQASNLLKFANLQLAAESLFGVLPTHTAGEIFDSRSMTEASLKFGNNRSSRFTDVQAEEFSKLWEVVEHKSNTVTGFSGTLFKAKSGGGAEVDALRAKYGIAVGELTVSLRSTEFADDAAPCAGSGLVLRHVEAYATGCRSMK